MPHRTAVAAEALDVHGDSGEDMLQVGLGLSPIAAPTHAVPVGELVDGALHSGTDRIPGLPVGRVLLGADAELQVAEFSRGKADVPGAVSGGGALDADRARLALALGEPRHDQRGGGGRGSQVGAMPAPADLPLGAGDLLAIEVDVEVVPVEPFVAAVLAGGVTRQRSGDGDLVFPGGVFQVDQGGVATVDQVLGGQQSTTLPGGCGCRAGPGRRSWRPRSWPRP